MGLYSIALNMSTHSVFMCSYSFNYPIPATALSVYNWSVNKIPCIIMKWISPELSLCLYGLNVEMLICSVNWLLGHYALQKGRFADLHHILGFCRFMLKPWEPHILHHNETRTFLIFFFFKYNCMPSYLSGLNVYHRLFKFFSLLTYTL